MIKEGIDEFGNSTILSLRFATSLCNVLDSTHKDNEPEHAKDDKPASEAKPKKSLEIRTTTWTGPGDRRYSFRGLFGFERNSEISTIGLVWGKNSFVPVPAARIRPSLCTNFLGLSRDLQKNIEGHLAFAGKFILGATVTTEFAGEPKFFNALDTIDVSWTIKTIGFASVSGKLSGLKVVYHNGKEVVHGSYEGNEKWTCNVQSELAVVRIVAGKLASEADGAFIDTIEFVRRGAEGSLPAWPLQVSTLRFLGEGDERVSKSISSIVEEAPKIGYTTWSIRGFYGEYNGDIITRLGVVWGVD